MRSTPIVASLGSLALLAVVCLGWQSFAAQGTTDTPTVDADVAADDTGKADPHYAVETAKVTLANGASGEVVIKVTPAEGFKWNLEYPAKLELTGESSKVSFDKKTFKQLAKDKEFEASEKGASIKVPMKAKAAGEETIAGKLKFSVCNKTSCHIKKVAVSLAVRVE